MEFPEVHVARKAFSSGKTLPMEFRRKQLAKFVELLEDEKNRARISEAVYKDMRKCNYEAIFTEILVVLAEYLDSECYHVVLADATGTKSLLTHRFDYIFFTGSAPVGKSILQVAAPQLTPVTLELGGKSPVYIHETACCKMAVKRILWCKCINMGQTCIAPDYVICSEQVQEAFIRYTKEIFNEWILLGGKSDEKDLWIEPTFIGNVKRDDILMEGEIFGPILPFVTVNSSDEAIDFINSTERPLALYIFSKDDSVSNKIMEHTFSGGVCINDTAFHVMDLRLPFGGTGQSGMGSYHGPHSVKTFSHQRAVVKRGLNYTVIIAISMCVGNWAASFGFSLANVMNLQVCNWKERKI
ncbi:unnamed protein product [Allacma fusca]|uniref:Aldehyde dehydrogenase domain-containing protein n=1 Tax=Allacma fusca TaxID=39272 RepID=A0A8J2KV26_9HEXA|nr:unnamed protein product [Allacma fusca]